MIRMGQACNKEEALDVIPKELELLTSKISSSIKEKLTQQRLINSFEAFVSSYLLLYIYHLFYKQLKHEKLSQSFFH